MLVFFRLPPVPIGQLRSEAVTIGSQSGSGLAKHFAQQMFEARYGCTGAENVITMSRRRPKLAVSK
jgi:hypothetical protein